MTNKEFCKLYSEYNGEKITHIDQIVSDIYDGRDLRNFVQYVLNSKLHQPTVSICACGSNEYYVEQYKDVTKYYCKSCHKKISKH